MIGKVHQLKSTYKVRCCVRLAKAEVAVVALSVGSLPWHCSGDAVLVTVVFILNPSTSAADGQKGRSPSVE